MTKQFFSSLILLFFFLIPAGGAAQEKNPAGAVITASLLLHDDSGARFPFPQHVTYAAGTILPDHLSRRRLDDDVRRAYERWKARYLRQVPGTTPSGGPLYRVSYGSVDPARTVSEGQGYGMVIVALMAGYERQARTIFDGLWFFSRLHPSSIDRRLMSWQVPEDPDSGTDSAFDGDADIACGLLLAHSQWGGNGEVDYGAAARQVITAIRESVIGSTSLLPLLGDWVKDAGDSRYNEYTPRSSDFMPAHFRSFGAMSGDDDWLRVVAAVRDAVDHMQAVHSHGTGLLPDFMVPVSAEDHTLVPAPPYFLEGAADGKYDYNAGRLPWRLGTDALLFGSDDSLRQVRMIANWIVDKTGGDPAAISNGYGLDGTPTEGDEGSFTTFFAAPFGVAAMTTPRHQQFLNKVYDAVVDVQEDYYEDSVTLLCLLVMSGNYWHPRE